jgi:hypothetical protein
MVRSALLKDMVGDWRAFLMTSDDAQLQQKTKYASRMARPMASEAFVRGLRTRLERHSTLENPAPRSNNSGDALINVPGIYVWKPLRLNPTPVDLCNCCSASNKQTDCLMSKFICIKLSRYAF